jgi:hypothetical protein
MRIRILTTLILCWPIYIASFSSGTPLFTADYYLLDPESYVGKTVTVSVSYLVPLNTFRDDGLREFNAYTSNQHQHGGYLPVLATPTKAKELAALCGTGRDVSKSTLIQGTFSKEEKGSVHAPRYYLSIK